MIFEGHLNIYDMDGTLVDSTAALRACQIEGLHRATGKDMSELEEIIKSKGLKVALQQYDIDQDTFFKHHYKTFDPFKAVQEGKMKVFDDAYSDINWKLHFGGEWMYVVSNSEIKATHKKLKATGIDGYFEGVLAEYEKSKSKPTAYMAMLLSEKLKRIGDLRYISSIDNFGDNPADMEFGDVLYETLSRAKGEEITLNNYFVDRGQQYSGTLPKSAKLINSILHAEQRH